MEPEKHHKKMKDDRISFITYCSHEILTFPGEIKNGISLSEI